MRLVEVVSGLATPARGQLDGGHRAGPGLGQAGRPGRRDTGFREPRRPALLRRSPSAGRGTGRRAGHDRRRADPGGRARMGPFALIDLVGQDVNEAVTRTVWAALRVRPAVRPVAAAARPGQGRLAGPQVRPRLVPLRRRRAATTSGRGPQPPGAILGRRARPVAAARAARPLPGGGPRGRGRRRNRGAAQRHAAGAMRRAPGDRAGRRTRCTSRGRRPGAGRRHRHRHRRRGLRRLPRLRLSTRRWACCRRPAWRCTSSMTPGPGGDPHRCHAGQRGRQTPGTRKWPVPPTSTPRCGSAPTTPLGPLASGAKLGSGHCPGRA